MEKPIGAFAPDQTIGEVIESLREIVKSAFVTCGFVADHTGRLFGVEKEERLSTPWKRSLFFRHPWLQLICLPLLSQRQ